MATESGSSHGVHLPHGKEEDARAHVVATQPESTPAVVLTRAPVQMRDAGMLLQPSMQQLWGPLSSSVYCLCLFIAPLYCTPCYH